MGKVGFIGRRNNWRGVRGVWREATGHSTVRNLVVHLIYTVRRF
jgi:hypothetical protein